MNYEEAAHKLKEIKECVVQIHTAWKEVQKNLNSDLEQELDALYDKHNISSESKQEIYSMLGGSGKIFKKIDSETNDRLYELILGLNTEKETSKEVCSFLVSNGLFIPDCYREVFNCKQRQYLLAPRISVVGTHIGMVKDGVDKIIADVQKIQENIDYKGANPGKLIVKGAMLIKQRTERNTNCQNELLDQFYNDAIESHKHSTNLTQSMQNYWRLIKAMPIEILQEHSDFRAELLIVYLPKELQSISTMYKSYKSLQESL